MLAWVKIEAEGLGVGGGGSKLMVYVSADETLMLNLYFIFLVCCHTAAYEICLHIRFVV